MANATAFSISTLQDLSNDIKNTPMQGVLGLVVELWTFESPWRLQILTFSKCWASPPHLAKVGLRQWNPLSSVNQDLHYAHIGCKVTNLVACGCHPTQKTYGLIETWNLNLQEKLLKFLIFKTPMGIWLKIIVGINKLFLSLPIQGRDIKYLISPIVSSLKCLLHFQDVNLERTHDKHGRTHKKHGNHLA